MKEGTPNHLFAKSIFITLFVASLVLTSLNVFFPQYGSISQLLDQHFIFRGQQLHSFIFWPFFTSLLNNPSFLQLSFFALLISFSWVKLQKWIPVQRLLSFTLLAGISSHLAHFLLDFHEKPIQGSGPIAIAYLFLLFYFYSDKVFFRVLNRPFNGKIILFSIIALDLLTINLGVRPDHSSVAAHMGAIFFVFLYIRSIPQVNLPYSFDFISEEDIVAEPTMVFVRSKEAAEAEHSNETKSQSSLNRETLECEINLILDKINDEGLQSLTTEDKEKLERASKIWPKKD